MITSFIIHNKGCLTEKTSREGFDENTNALVPERTWQVLPRELFRRECEGGNWMSEEGVTARNGIPSVSCADPYIP
jgi:hypothetical protein